VFFVPNDALHPVPVVEQGTVNVTVERHSATSPSGPTIGSRRSACNAPSSGIVLERVRTRDGGRMAIRDRIVADLTAAMKAKDTQRLGVVRMLKSRIMEAEVEERARKGPGHVLEDKECLAVIATYARQRRDSIDAFRKGGKEDLATKEEAELAIVQQYLPAPMSEDAVRKIVAAAIADAGATSAKEIGAIMKLVMPRLKGEADGALVNRIVRELLGQDVRD